MIATCANMTNHTITYTIQPDLPSISPAPKKSRITGISKIPSDTTINTIQMIISLKTFCHFSMVTLFQSLTMILSSFFILVSFFILHLFFDIQKRLETTYCWCIRCFCGSSFYLFCLFNLLRYSIHCSLN